MKKLFSLFVLVLLSSQTWAAYNVKVYVVGIDGTSYTTSTTERTYGTITATGFDSYSWDTGSSYKCYHGVVSSGTQKFKLTAVPATGYEFVGWYDGKYSSSTRKSTNTTLETDRSFASYSSPVAHFRKIPTYSVSVSVNPVGAGTVSASPSTSISSGGSSSLSVTSTAGGYTFDGWYDGSTKLSSSANYTLSNITSNRTIVGKFNALVTNVTVAVDYATGSDNTMGSIGGGTTVAAQTSVNLTATASANSNYYFKGWSTTQDGNNIINGSNVSPFAVSASNTTYYAVFAAYKTSSISPTGSGSHTVWNTPVSIAGGVDLGLPSGLIWADKNVGAANTGEYGSYFAWGETTAMTSVPEASTYGFKDSQYDSYNTLPAAYDAASVNLGNGWRMPTRAEFQELMDHATWSAGTYRWNVSGNGNTINFPFCGHISSQYPANNTNFGRYWTSDKFSGTGSMKRPYYVDFQSNYTYSIKYDNSDASTNCWVGYSVRAVHAGATAYTLTIRAKVGDDIVVTNTYRCDYGEKVQITADVPNGYNFVKWADNNSTATTREFTVTANATYNVIYEESVSYVTATFNNWNGSLLEEYTDVESGTTPTYSGSDPTKPADETYTYAFSGWSPELDDITENTTYTAQFTPTYINYSVTFRTSEEDANPNVKSDYHYGDEISNCPALDPQRIGDETHTYTFLGWYLDNTETRYEAGMTISGNMVFTARFDEQIVEVVPVTYNVTIGSFAANGKVIVTSQGNVREVSNTGAVLTFDAGKSLTIQAVPNARYHFDSWVEDAEEEAVIDIRTLSEDMTYTPVFAANEALTLEDTHDEAYYNALYAEHDGEVLTVTMEGRQLTEGSWMTFCVPFDFSIPAGHPFRGAVYAFQNATMSGTNTAAYISLDFRRTYEMKANVPYLIVPTMTTLSDLEFDGVMIDQVPSQEAVTAESGQVQFVSMPWQTTLVNDAQKPDFYLATGNNLRYVKTEGGTTFRAFRAYFHRLVNLGAAARRVVISLDGVETTKEIGEDGEIEDMTTKRMENGVLYIERNGVRYDAQGQRAE